MTRKKKETREYPLAIRKASRQDLLNYKKLSPISVDFEDHTISTWETTDSKMIPPKGYILLQIEYYEDLVKELCDLRARAFELLDEINTLT